MRHHRQMKTHAFRPLLVFVALLSLGAFPSAQDVETVFRGRPAVKVSEGRLERMPEQISTERAINLECVISRIGDRFFWATRQNTELRRTESGAFITFAAINGSGYVRVIKAEMKAAASLMSPTEAQFDYVVHALIGLRSVTYHGARR